MAILLPDVIGLKPPSARSSPSAATATTAKAPSKFVALMAGEDRVLEAVPNSQPVDWQPHAHPCLGFGSDELTAKVIDPAAAATTEPREMHLIKGLLSDEEIDNLLSQFIALGSDGSSTHARVIIEDGRVECPELLTPFSCALHDRILPYVQSRYGDSRVVVADALMRAYRQVDRRQALAPHFDTSSFATVIIPLNPGEYEGGLYVQEGASLTSRRMIDPSFEKGDVLVHRFDVMHGVEVTQGDRYSLVLWLSDCQESVDAAATPWLEGAAESGNTYAQFLYSEACQEGRYCVSQDEARAVDYASRAARQGHALSQHRLGYRFKAGRGVPQSDERCRELWQQAAAADLAAAQIDLARCFAFGYLGLSDHAEARRWYEHAARQGHPDAAVELRHLDWLEHSSTTSTPE